MRLLERPSLVTTQKVLCLAWNKLVNLNFRLTSSFSLRKLFFILDQLQLDVKFILNQMHEWSKNFTKMAWDWFNIYISTWVFLLNFSFNCQVHANCKVLKLIICPLFINKGPKEKTQRSWEFFLHFFTLGKINTKMLCSPPPLLYL